MTQTAVDLAGSVHAVNNLLEAREPDNISTDEHSGYTGYKPQYIIDAMNDIFGIGMWGFEEVSSEIVSTGDKGGLLAVAQVKVWLKDVQSTPVGWGQSRVTRGDIGDARKGAQTDAIKKALSYFSIGNRAYQGLLKEDGKSNHTPKAQPKPAPSKPVHPLANGNGSPAKPKAHTLPEVKAFFTRLKYREGQWRGFKSAELGMDVSDEGLTDDELETLWRRLTRTDEDMQARAGAVMTGAN